MFFLERLRTVVMLDPVVIVVLEWTERQLTHPVVPLRNGRVHSVDNLLWRLAVRTVAFLSLIYPAITILTLGRVFVVAINNLSLVLFIVRITSRGEAIA